MIKKILMRLGKKYYWEQGDLHTDSGVVKEEDLKKNTNRVNAHSGKELIMFDANFTDNIEKIKRGPQAMMEKDIGYIITRTGIDKNSVVLEAGTGSGKLTIYLARLVKKVHSYDTDESNLNLAKKNIALFDLKNVDLKNKDVYENIDEKDLDLVVLDLPEPWNALDNVYDSLKSGSYLVVYVPSVTQVIQLVENLKDKFVLDEVIEIMKRDWFVEGLKVRPKSEMQYTAFMIFVRKV
ncbi:MAG: methyltransferase domain-containing protein [Candidatus Nanoarchaeia archaeon]|nr:methyltransferase domain-containing protein [Candidatus Nanoarchaeia archaeon]